MVQSGKWGMKVPLIANAGKSVFPYKALSFGFTVDKKDNMSVFIHLPGQTFSIVDYLNSIDEDSSFENREKLLRKQWPKESYSGTSDQNLRLLNMLLTASNQLRIPQPSSKLMSQNSSPEKTRLN